MNVSDLLNPVPLTKSRQQHNHHHQHHSHHPQQQQQQQHHQRTRCVSTPVIPSSSSYSRGGYYPHIKQEHTQHIDLHQLHQQQQQQHQQNVIGKPRSRFSEYEDNVIRQGVAQRLTWGQISDLLPHRKRATCFNRYRTLQGIRKSRKLSEPNSPEMSSSLSPTSPVTSCFSDPKTPPSCNYAQVPPLTTNTWFSSHSSEIIYDQAPVASKYPTSSYANDISSISSSSDLSSDDNDDFSFAAQPTPAVMGKRTHKISLPALDYPHHRSSTIQPYYSL